MSAEMDRIEQRCRDQLAALRDTREALEQVRVTVSSPNEVLRVRLDGACRLVDLTLTAAALRLGDRLGPLIVDTCAVAAREVTARRARIMTDFHRDFIA
jgi:DNA-binding protein YbaB